MARKKRSKARKPASKSAAGKANLVGRINAAQRNFVLFLVLFIVSFIIYSFSYDPLFVNFFGIFSMLFGFIAFAFLIALIVLFILNSKKR